MYVCMYVFFKLLLVQTNPDGAAGRTLDPAVPTVERFVKDSALPITKMWIVLVTRTAWRAKRWLAPHRNAVVSKRNV